MKRKGIFVLSLLLALCLLFSSCAALDNPADKDPSQQDDGSDKNNGQSTADFDDSGEIAEKVDTEKTDIPEDLPEAVNTLTITVSEGTEGCYSIADGVLTFSGLTADTVCRVAGEFDGQIVIDGGEDYQFELEMCGLTLYSAVANPITVLSGDKVTLTAKKESKNFIYDKREAVSEDDEEAISAAVWADVDLDLGGKGELTVISENNNGIHTKDDLEVKNLTLSVTCQDNALKGNDSVEIKGGVLTLIAKCGDGIKTSNTDVSSKGNQRGTVSISAGTVNVYAACDGIDAAYNADISEDAIVNIYTDKYSPYSETVESEGTSNSERYIRFTSKTYNYSVKYYNSDSDYQWVNAVYAKSVSGSRNTYYYYAVEKLTGYSKVQIFLYSSSQTPGQEKDYTVKSDYMTWNASYDTFALEQRGSSLSYNWTNYSSTVNDDMGGFGPGGGGPGGMNEGNSDKGEYSTKGIKADNEIHISGGTVTVKSYDDALHANGDATLENGSSPTGNVTISGGNLSLFSKDDGIHADGVLTVTGGTVVVENSYEGLEGTQIVMSGGSVSVISSDDGFNATATSGIGITFEGGTVYVYAGGDGLDANSRTSYQGIVFAGGDITVVSTSAGNSSIDTEQGYTYSGGNVLAVCPSNGMGSESTKCQNFSSIGTKTTMSLKSGQTLTVKTGLKEAISVEMPCSLSALVIYLGSSSASISAS